MYSTVRTANIFILLKVSKINNILDKLLFQILYNYYLYTALLFKGKMLRFVCLIFNYSANFKKFPILFTMREKSRHVGEIKFVDVQYIVLIAIIV